MAAVGLLKYIEYTVSEPSYFKLNTDHTPLHLVLLDEVIDQIADSRFVFVYTVSLSSAKVESNTTSVIGVYLYRDQSRKTNVMSSPPYALP